MPRHYRLEGPIPTTWPPTTTLIIESRLELEVMEHAKKLELEFHPFLVGEIIMMCFGITGLGDDVI
jgi:Fe-S cluster biosynthesis and repair protein YggX